MLNAGLIGLGKMGKYHLNLYGDIKDVKLVGICDANAEVVNELAEKTGVKGYTDYKEMFPYVDAITIAAPTRFHYEIAKECLLAGKHLLVEKPITTNYDQAKELFDIAISKNLVLHIGHVERFNGAVQEIRKIAENPRFVESKRVAQFNSNFRADSIVLDLMIHDIDIILNLVGSPVKSIQAMGSKVYTELADFASVNIAFENDTVANLFVSRMSQIKERYMTVYEKDALYKLDFTTQDINIYRQGQTQQTISDKELRYKNEFIQERLFVYKENPLKSEITHFINCVTGKTKRTVTVEHDLASLNVALKTDELLRKGTFGYIDL